MSKKIILLVLIINFAQNSFGQRTTSTGTIHSNPILIGTADSLYSTILSETRVINISLPEDYSPDSATRYPVIYLLDGAVDEDFIHISGLVRFNTTPWVDRFPPSIVVGIANTDRKRDFTFAVPDLGFLVKMGFSKTDFPIYGGSEKFIAFIEKELQPYIQSRYKASSYKTIIGESLGGLLATEILVKKPVLFNNYIIVSPSLWWGDEKLLVQVHELIRKPLPASLKIYVGAAKKEEDLVMYNDAVSLAQSLRKELPAKLRCYFDYLAEETHATILHQAVYNAFKLLNTK